MDIPLLTTIVIAYMLGVATARAVGIGSIKRKKKDKKERR